MRKALGSKRNDFTICHPVPDELKFFLKQHPEIRLLEKEGCVMRFNSGVELHSDPENILLWVIDGCRHRENQLINEHSRTYLNNGTVLHFNAKKEHAVVATTHSDWIVYGIFANLRRTKKVVDNGSVLM